jgi:hypothetical protein
MGTQQLLLIVIGVVIVGIMIAVGIFMFRDQSAATNRDAMSNDLVALATAAQKYNRRAATFGGGGGTFNNMTMRNLTTRPANSNGSYRLIPDPVPVGQTFVTIIGTGMETGNDGSSPVLLTMTVMADSILLVTTN